MRKILIMLVVCAVLSGCATIAAKRQVSFINYSKNFYSAHEKDYPIDLYFKDIPQKPYEVIGDIIGYVVHDNNLRPLLETKARQIGADGVMDIETFMGTQIDDGTSYKVINIKAKAIKYK